MNWLISLGLACALFFSMPYGESSCSALCSGGVQDASESAQSASVNWAMPYEVAAFENVQRSVEMRKEFGHQADGIILERPGVFIIDEIICRPLIYKKVFYLSRVIAWTGYGEVHQFFKA